jgi:hypothetical protein
MGCHHKGWRLDVLNVVGDDDALRFESAQNSGVVYEVAKDREGTGVGVLVRERDGIAHAKAHAEVDRSNDAHRRHASLPAIPAAIALPIFTVTHPASAKASDSPPRVPKIMSLLGSAPSFHPPLATTSSAKSAASTGTLEAPHTAARTSEISAKVRPRSKT